MPYKLRPESKLKRPSRYQSESDDDLENASNSGTSDAEPREHNPEDSTRRIKSAVGHSRPGESSLTSPHRAEQSRDMANIKHVRPKRKSDTQERSIDDIGRAARARLQATQPPVELTALTISHPQAQSAAFPSLPTDQAAAGPVEQPNDHGLPRRVHAIKKCNQADIERCERAVDAMYACKRFPEDMSVKQKEWYTELQKCWLPGEELAQDIEFKSLYPSLRATIIEQMYNAFPKGDWYDGHLPVRHLLQINTSDFNKIVEENARVWETDEIPAHLLRLKQQNPGKAIDPETPPQTGVVRAIRWLKQMHLPGSLLGEWQFPLPNVEAFIVPFETVVDDIAFDAGVNREPSLTSSDGDTTDVDEDDDFEISLTESYLDRVVHTRPHTHNPPQYTSREPDLLLPEKLEQFARSKGIIRDAPPVPINNDPLNVFSVPSLPGPSSHNKQPVPSKSSKSKPSASTPSLPQSSLNSLAANHADRLWAEHQFNNLDLTIEPTYLASKPSTAFEAVIQLELCTLWKNALAKHLARIEKRWVAMSFAKEFKEMSELLDDLRRRILQLQQAVLTLEAGGEVDWNRTIVEETTGVKGKEKEGEVNGKKKQGKEKAHVLERSKEPNCGFGPSTRIIRFEKDGEAAREEGSNEAPAEVVESIEVARPETQTTAVPHTPKKAAEVIDLEAPAAPTPQSKKRAVEVIELEEEGGSGPQTKKAKTTANGENEPCFIS